MKTLTGVTGTIATTTTFPEDHRDKRTSASLETATQSLLNSITEINRRMNTAIVDRQRFDEIGSWEMVENDPLWTANVTGGTLSLFIESGESPNYGAGYYDGPRGRYVHSADVFNCDVYARLVSFTVPDAGNSNMICYLNTVGEASSFYGLGAAINSNGDVFALSMSNDVYGSVQSGFPLDGTGWVRVSKRGSLASAYWGIGSSTAMPTSWTYLGSHDTGTAALTHVTLVAKHWSTGSSTDSTFVWDDCIIVNGTSYPTL